MSTLHDRLADLADDAPVGAPGPDLWDRGRRYSRVRRTGTLGIVATVLLLVAVVVGATWPRSTPGELRPAGAPGGVPERVYEPSPWLPGTDDGLLGALAVTLPTTRQGWFGASEGVVGVSAATGEYRFLDLPDLATDQSTALSPDGRHVAYWLTGRPSGSTDDQEPVVGFALHDTTTGETERHEIKSDFGLSADGFLWTDRGRLLVGYSVYQDESGSYGVLAPLLELSPGDADPSAPRSKVTGWDLRARPAGDRITVTAMRDDTYRVLDLSGEADVIRFTSPENLWDAPLVGPDGSRLAGVRAGVRGVSSGSNPGALMVGRIAGPGSGSPDRSSDLTVLPGHPWTLEVLGWADATTVVTREQTGPQGEEDIDAIVRTTDVVTQESQQLTLFPSRDPGIQVARDLLAAPSVPAVRPPTPWRPRDPRSFLIAVGGFGAFGLVLLVLRRRRVRA